MAMQVILAIAILLCSLVAGLVFTFAIVVMPGIKSLDDRDFLNAFVVMDKVIQNNHPLFILVWVGSAIAVGMLAVLSLWHLDGINRSVAIALSCVYLLGVQLPTILINIPLNNELQSLDLEALREDEIASAREKFEHRWMYWNQARTIVATFVSAGLIVLALRL